MRTKVLFLMMAMAAICRAEDIKKVVLTTNPVMHCENCQNRIQSNISKENGVKGVVADLATKTVTVTYDADVTSVNDIIAGFSKINYTASIAGQPANGDCCGNGKGGACGCSQKAQSDTQAKTCGCTQKK